MQRIKQIGSPAVLIGIIVAVLVVVIVMSVVLRQHGITVQIDGTVYQAKVAYTEADRQKGLGGVTEFSGDQAMILAFPSDNTWAIWMKDMKVPIDVMWLDSNKKIVHVVTDISPDEGTNVRHAPPVPARYVVELPAGSLGKNTISGMTAEFDITQGEVK
jgi:uncharacterized protein